jgi:two-component system LytT family response regulator
MMSRPFRVLVVDDEPLARRRIARLARAEADVEVVAECSGGREAIAAIAEHRPDLVLLDVQMPDIDGFGVVRKVGADAMPTTVFVTAFSEYAVRAFETAAVDYVVKPFGTDRFLEAFRRARQRVEERDDARDGQRLRESLRRMLSNDAIEHGPEAPTSTVRVTNQRLMIRDENRAYFIKPTDVDWMEADGNYVRLHVGKSSYLIRSTATRLQEELDPDRFARIHRRYLVNLDRVVGLEPWFGGDAVVLLRDGTKLRLSRNFREAFLARMLGDHTESAERNAEE